jgi:hypothetical protein
VLITKLNAKCLVLTKAETILYLLICFRQQPAVLEALNDESNLLD